MPDSPNTPPVGPRQRDSGASLFGIVADGLNGLGTALIIGIMVLVFVEIVARGVFNRPIEGIAYIVALSIVSIVFLQLASTLRHGRMPHVDIFIDGFRRRNPRAGGLLQAVFDLTGVAVCIIILWASWPKLDASWTDNEFVGLQGQFTAPIWPMRLIIVIGATLTGIQYAIHMVEDVKSAIGRRVR